MDEKTIEKMTSAELSAALKNGETSTPPTPKASEPKPAPVAKASPPKAKASEPKPADAMPRRKLARDWDKDILALAAVPKASAPAAAHAPAPVAKADAKAKDLTAKPKTIKAKPAKTSKPAPKVAKAPKKTPRKPASKPAKARKPAPKAKTGGKTRKPASKPAKRSSKDRRYGVPTTIDLAKLTKLLRKRPHTAAELGKIFKRQAISVKRQIANLKGVKIVTREPNGEIGRRPNLYKIG